MQMVAISSLAVNSSITRFARQTDIIPQDKLDNLLVNVIGVGAIGRQVTLQLASLGVRKLHLVDFDKVEETNVTTQGYHKSDIGLAKVVALSNAVNEIDDTIELILSEDRFRPKLNIGGITFCCVDNMSSRKAIWNSVSKQFDFWVDGRMLGETIRILSATKQSDIQKYSDSLFADEEAQQGRCTAQGVIYTANIAAGLMLQQFVRWLRGQATDCDLIFNLLASEIIVE